MKARFLDAAEEDFDRATGHYIAIDASLGRRFVEAVDRCIRTIESRPLTFPKNEHPVPGREVRSLSLDGFPYSIIYEVRTAEILLVAVAHHSRKPGYWNRRKS